MSELEHWMTVTAQPRPANLHAHYDLGLCYLAAGNLPEALTHLIVAQRQDSDNVALCFLLGKVNERLGRRLDAVRFYKEALRVRPDCAGFSRARSRWARES